MHDELRLHIADVTVPVGNAACMLTGLFLYICTPLLCMLCSFRRYVKSHDVGCREQLGEAFEQSDAALYENFEHFHEWTIGNAAAVIAPHVRKLDLITYPQAFEVSTDKEGDVIVRFKHRASDKHWCGMRRAVVTGSGEEGVSMNPREAPHKLFHGRDCPDLTDLPALEHKAVLEEEIKQLRTHVAANTKRLRICFGPQSDSIVAALEKDIDALTIKEEFPCRWDTRLYSGDSTLQEDDDEQSGSEDEENTDRIETSISRSKQAVVNVFNDARYDVGNFVTVLGEADNGSGTDSSAEDDDADVAEPIQSFWVGCIQQRPYKQKQPRDVVMKVLWYEPQRNQQYNTWLYPCTQKSDSGGTCLYISEISVNSVTSFLKPIKGAEKQRGAIKVPPAVYRELTSDGQLDRQACDV